MEESKPNAIEPYRLKDLAGGGTLEITTLGNVAIPVSLDLLKRLVRGKPTDREPDTAELVMFANTIIEQKCNPYLNECWLILMKGKYCPVIAAQKRIAKAQSLPSYDGYEWGWIDKEGNRCESGPGCTVKEADIDGVWGRVYFKDRKVPFYHEIWKKEYPHQFNDRPTTMLMKTARDQVHKYAFANEMGNLCTENEPQDAIEALPKPECDVKSRDLRRKPVESTTVTDLTGSNIAKPADAKPLVEESIEPSAQEQPAEPNTEVDSDVAGSAGAEETEPEIIDAELADETAKLKLSNDLQDLKDSFDEKDSKKTFTEWAADVLCVGEDEVEKSEDYTADMIERLKIHLSDKGV